MAMRPPTHRPAGWRPAEKRKDPYYSSPEHLAFRAAVLKRDGYRCADPNCRTPNRGAGGRLIADHVVPRTEGGSNHVSNGLTRCTACDNRKHREKGAKRRD